MIYLLWELDEEGRKRFLLNIYQERYSAVEAMEFEERLYDYPRKFEIEERWLK